MAQQKTTRSTSTRKKRTKAKPTNKKLNISFDFLKDTRTHKVLGLFCILIGLYLFIAFASYLFTWKDDQMHFLPLSFGFPFSDAIVENKLGRMGSFLSHIGFYNLGASSFVFVFVFIALGVRILSTKKLFSFMNVLKYAFWLLILGSIGMGFFFSHKGFPYGGIFGDSVSGWLESFIGFIGTGLLLLFFFILLMAHIFDIDFDDFINSMQRIFKFRKFEMPSFSGIPSLADLKEKLPQVGDGDTTKRKRSSTDSKTKKPRTTRTVSPPKEDLVNVNEQGVADSKAKAIKLTPTTPPPKKKIGATGEKDLVIDIKAPPTEGTIITGISKEEDVVIEKGDYDPTADLPRYKTPPLDLLEFYGNDQAEIDMDELEKNKDRIVETLRNYNIEIDDISATPGATITLYEIVPAPGIKISKIRNLRDDIALSLAALGIRIIAPIPGKGTIGIEIPNENKKIVSLWKLLNSKEFQKTKMELPVALGTGISAGTYVADLTKMPHLLMAGATGQGKSVALNNILVSLLYKKHPAEVKFVMIDPKKVELSIYNKIEKHFLASLPGEEEAIVTDTRKVINTLNALCIEMDGRYDLLKKAQVRNLRAYNKKFIKRRLNPEKGHRFLPYFVLVIDEFADLMLTAGKEVELPLTRLAQLARAVGIHLVIATQRPTVNIITGTIKANFPVRIAFRVTSKIDSRTIIDTAGAEHLIGRGDMILIQGAESHRLQGAFVDTPEVERIVEFIGNQQGYAGAFELPEYGADDEDGKGGGLSFADRDEFFEDAARLIVSNQSGSTSLIQRKMRLGYNRAGRIMDQLEATGVVGPNQGSKAREVYILDLAELEEYFKRMNS